MDDRQVLVNNWQKSLTTFPVPEHENCYNIFFEEKAQTHKENKTKIFIINGFVIGLCFIFDEIASAVTFGNNEKYKHSQETAV